MAAVLILGKVGQCDDVIPVPGSRSSEKSHFLLLLFNVLPCDFHIVARKPCVDTNNMTLFTYHICYNLMLVKVA